MRRFLLIAGLFALAIGLLWIGQGTGTIAWPRSSFMVNQLQWAGYGAAMAGFGLVLIWQSNQQKKPGSESMTSNRFDRRGKVAIVTGGNGGIGLGLAHGLADAGAD